MNSMHATNKPFNIEKRLVYEAYKAVKSNRGAAGVDEQTIEQFEADLSGNLYKIWNRMSSGTYFPPPVRAVAIPKKSGGERILGVPTVADRVAQMVVKMVIEPILDPRRPRSSIAKTESAKANIRTSNLTSSDIAFGLVWFDVSEITHCLGDLIQQSVPRR
jgi:retron-type reverse transcriptase